MEPKYISLQKFCKNRFLSFPKPSVSDKVFKVQDFKSPDFVDRVTSHAHLQNTSTQASMGDLRAIVEEVNQVFRSIENELSIFKEKLVKKLLAFCTSDDRSNELNLLNKELKACHSALRDNITDPTLMENFVQLLEKHKQAANSHGSSKMLIKTTTEKLDEMATAFSSSIKACEELTRINSPQPLLVKHKLGDLQVDTAPSQSTIEEAKYPVKVNLSLVLASLLFEYQGEQHLFLLMNVYRVKLIYTVYNLDQKKQVSSTSIFKVFQAGKGTRACYSKTLNCIVISDDNYVFNFYHFARGGLKKITSITCQFSPELSYFGIRREACISVLDNHSMLATAFQRELKLVSIFTKKTVYEQKRPSLVFDIKYIEKLNLFVAIDSDGTVDIYDIIYRGGLRIKYHMILKIGKEIEGVIFEDNVVVISSTTKPKRLEVLEVTDGEVTTKFHELDSGSADSKIALLSKHRKIFASSMIYMGGGDRIFFGTFGGLISRIIIEKG